MDLVEEFAKTNPLVTKGFLKLSGNFILSFRKDF